MASGTTMSCPAAMAPPMIPIASPRRPSNHRAATVAAVDMRRRPSPEPSTRPPWCRPARASLTSAVDRADTEQTPRTESMMTGGPSGRRASRRTGRRAQLSSERERGGARQRGPVPAEVGLHRLDEHAEDGPHAGGHQDHEGTAQDDPRVVRAAGLPRRHRLHSRAPDCLRSLSCRLISLTTSSRVGIASTAPGACTSTPPVALATRSAASTGAPAARAAASAPLKASPAPTVSIAST